MYSNVTVEPGAMGLSVKVFVSAGADTTSSVSLATAPIRVAPSMVAVGTPVVFVFTPPDKSSGTVTSTSNEHELFAAMVPPLRRMPCLSVSIKESEIFPPPHSVEGRDGELTATGNVRNPERAGPWVSSSRKVTFVAADVALGLDTVYLRTTFSPEFTMGLGVKVPNSRYSTVKIGTGSAFSVSLAIFPITGLPSIVPLIAVVVFV